MSLITEFRPIFTLTGGTPAIMDFPEAAAQTFTPGQAVYLSSGKDVKEAATANTLLLGIAAGLASGTAVTAQSVWILNGDTVFEGVPSTPGNVTNRDEVGTFCDLEVAAGDHKIDEDGSGEDVFFIVDADLTSGRVRLHAIATANSVMMTPFDRAASPAVHGGITLAA